MRRGFVIAVDALFALVIVFALIGLAFDSFSRDASAVAQHQQLVRFAESAGGSLEQSGIVGRAVIGNTTNELRAFLNAWPVSRCGSVSIYANPDTNTPTLVLARPGCGVIDGDVAYAHRGVMVANPPDANLYVVEIGVWVNST